MSNVAEKAQFYLEDSAPQLRAWEKHGIFSADELRTIVTTRSDHEHRVLSPRSPPSDWIAYITWDIALETLRQRRCKKLNVRNTGGHISEARISRIYERALKHHPGCIDLWHRHLDYALSIGGAKRWNKVFVKVVRLHPRRPEFWIMGGKRAAAAGDMTKARALFLRGCRFCVGPDGGGEKVWTEYAKAEMEWLGKTEKKIGAGAYAVDHPEDFMSLRAGGDDAEEDDEEEVVEGAQIVAAFEDAEEDKLPQPTKEERKAVDDATADKLANSPAIGGAIPLAIFDLAGKQEFWSPETGVRFFEMFAGVGEVGSKGLLLKHVLEVMEETYPESAETAFCRLRMPFVGPKDGEERDSGVREMLSIFPIALQDCEDQEGLVKLVVPWLDEVAMSKKADLGVRRVVIKTKERLEELVGGAQEV